MTQDKSQDPIYKMSTADRLFKLAVFDLPSEIEDAPFYESYSHWVSCFEQELIRDLQSLIYNKTLVQLYNLDEAHDYFSFCRYSRILPIEAEDRDERFLSLCSISPNPPSCYEWLSEFVFSAIRASCIIPTCKDARHAVWLTQHSGAFLVKTLQNFPLHEKCDRRLEGMRLQVLGGV